MISGRILVFSIILVTTAAKTFVEFTETRDIAPYKELYFKQSVDHFNFHWETYRADTYKQRYLLQDQWWARGKGPIFFYTGNEGDIVGFWNNTGFMFEVAEKFNALVVFAEHRFYGKSIPFGNESFDHPYVDLLTAEQAMADYIVLLDDLKTGLNATQCPVIAFGGSYGGMLSAYLRMHYPNIITGSIASSAPIYVVANLSPRDQFFIDVTKDFDDAVSGCKDSVVKAFTAVKDLFSAGIEGLKSISKTFHLCSTVKAKDYRLMIGWMRNAFTILAMMDYPYPTDFLTPLPGYPVKEACKRILNSSSPISGLASVIGLVYGESRCHDLDIEYVECSDPTGCGTGTNSLAWDYQSCTEFMMPGGTNNVTDMFPPLPFTLEERDVYCQQRWHVKPRNNWARLNFWGKDISSASNIVFANGLLDPWAGGGVLKNVSESVVSVIIEEGAHHLDLRRSNKADPPSVVQARQVHIQHISKWIKQHWQKQRL